MSNGRPPRIEAVIFDAMFTIFRPKMSRAELVARVFSDVARVRIDPDVLAERILGLRRMQPRMPEISIAAYWTAINAAVLAELRPRKYSARKRMRLGLRIHREILSNPDLYTVSRAMRDLLEWTRGCIPIALASSQERRSLNRHLYANGLRSFFGAHTYAADEVGHPKSSPVFWETVIAQLGISGYAAFAHVGNSAESDLDPARQGTPTALFDPERRIPGLSISGVGVVHDEGELRTWIEQVLVRHEDAAEAG